MIFVTGATGMLGSHVLLRLAEQSQRFRALKREKSSLDLCRRIFSYYNSEALFTKINWVNGDICDISSLEDGMKGCDLLLHCAGVVSFFKSDIDLLKKNNIEGTANVMNVALSSGIKKVGYVSSIAALGRNSTTALVDEDCYFKPTKLESNYALSKYFAEQEVWRASAEGLDVVIVNPSVILGPGGWNKGSPKIFEKIYNGLKFYSVGGTGYVDVVDVADVLVKLLFSDEKNQRFVVSAVNLKYRECFDRIAIALGKRKASTKVTPFLKEIAWRWEFLKSIITGERPLITKETANSAMLTSTYSSAKVMNTLNFEFTDINYTINKYSDWFIADRN